MKGLEKRNKNQREAEDPFVNTYRELQVKVRDLKFLSDLALELTNLDNDDHLSGLFTKKIKNHTGSDFASYSRYNPSNGAYETVHTESDSRILNLINDKFGSEILQTRVSISFEMYDEILSEKVKFFESLSEITSGAIPPFLDKALQKLTGFVNFCVVSLAVGDQLIGGIMLAFKSGQPLPDREMLLSFINLAAVSMQRRNAETIQNIQFNIAHAVTGARDLQQLFQIATEELSRVIDTSNIYIALLNEETGMLTAPFDRDPEDQIPPVWPAEGSLTGYLISCRKTLCITRPEMAELNAQGKIRLMGKPSEAWLGSPIFSGTRIIGALVVQNFINRYAYNRQSAELTSLVATQLGIYIDRKKAEADAAMMLKAVYQSPVSIVITDPKGSIEYVNPKFTEICGYTPEEVIGKNSNILKSGHHAESFYKELWKTITDGKDWKGEILNRNKNGGLYWVNAIISPIFDDTGSIIHFLSVKEDITDKKRMIEDLRIAKHKAEESDRLKTAFLNNMSHEIRTPLNGILGFTELLIDPQSSQEERAYYGQVIFSSSEQLVSIIDDIIQISTIEAGQEKLRESIVSNESLFNDLNNQFKPRLKEGQISLDFKIHPSLLGLRMKTDKVKLMQILTNLIGNAIKFTEKGSIRIEAYIEDTKVHYRVSDEGIGIPPEYIHVIFDRFRQAHTGSTREYGGNGLGLSISKAYVELMGGEIAVESEPGKGSTFYFHIPLKTD